MKKMFKRTTAIAASALMIGQMVPFNVFADQTNGLTDLRIHPYVLDEAKYKQAKEAEYIPQGDGETDRTQANKYGTEDTSITFDIVEVNTDGSVKENGYHDEGKAVFTNLPNAFYKIVPNRENHTDVRFKDAESFYVHLPAVVSGAALFDVDIYPKLTDNNDNNDNTDPETLTDPQDPNSNDKHSIKLTKTLSDPNDKWGTGTGGVGEAIFDIYYKDTLGNWVNADENTHFTTTGGILKVDGLPLGTYYAVEVQAPNGYLLDQTPIKFVLDGTANAIQTYTFPNDKKLKVAKEVVTEGDNTGNIYNWKITADIPGNAQNLISYAVTDKYENQKDVTITSVVATNGTNTLTLASTDYTTSTGTGTLTVTLTSEGIAKLDPYTSLEINVTSTIADDYSTGKVVNESSITYKYAYDPDDNDPNDEIPDDIPEPSDTYPTTISYPDPVNPEPDADNAKDEFTPATITISNYETGKSVELSGGVYEISRCSQHKDSDYSDDVVTLANLAPGEYTIKQLATKSGYYVEEDAAKNTKTIYIDKDGTVYEGTEASHTTVLANNKVIFYNDPTVEGFNLPFTGTTATIVFTIAGIGVMGGAMFFIFILFKKRDKDEEDKENA